MHCYLTLSKHDLVIDTAGLTLTEILFFAAVISYIGLK